MLRIAQATLGGVVLVACAGPNSSLNTVQFAYEKLPFSANYQVETAKVVRDRGGHPTTVLVSYPRQNIGIKMMSAQRWYVCLRGMPAPPPSTRIPMAADFVAQLLLKQPPDGRHDFVFTFSRDSSRPWTALVRRRNI